VNDTGSSLTLVAALSCNRAIGRNNSLPWRISRDLRRFKALTMGKPVLMGRLTFESIGRALPGRENLVVTRRGGYLASGCRVFHDLAAAIAAAGERELMVIGGAEVYRQTLPLARRMHLTHVDAHVDGDAFFPEFEARSWRVERDEAHPATPDQPLGYRFVDYVRV
jgi:dihydrofolate reductase